MTPMRAIIAGPPSVVTRITYSASRPSASAAARNVRQASISPAPNAREVTWKRAQLEAEKWKYTGLSAERIKKAIADDLEWLEAHPTRKGGRKPRIPDNSNERAHCQARARRPVWLRPLPGGDP